jgi:enamine deaminase RidA (YjgF/YER057c/UK114 family)
MEQTPIERWPASGPGRSRIVAWQGLVFTVANARTHGAPLDEQLEETFQLLDASLREAGSTRERLLSVQVILDDIEDRAAFDAAWRQWIGDDPAGWPQRAVFGGQLAPGLLVEIVATAAR